MAWWKRGSTATDDVPADPALPLIRLEGVTRIFRGDADEETRALDEVTLDIDRGEYISVSGPSGCGKSTLLSILGLLDAPTSGRYWFGGRRVDRLAPGEKARIRNVDVGLIFQSFNLIGDMTVYENVEYPLTLRGVASADRAARVTAALDRVKLSPLAFAGHSEFGGLNRWCHIWAYKDAAERFAVRDKARKEGIWPPKGGQPGQTLVQENMLVVPAAFSPLH